MPLPWTRRARWSAAISSTISRSRRCCGERRAPADLAAIIDEQRDGTPEGELRARLCATIFLVGQLPESGAMATGIQADAATLARPAGEDLRNGSADIDQRIPQLLDALVEKGTLMPVV